MSYIAKPKVHHPSLKKNEIGLTRRDYEGAITTLCAGCGHDSITAAVIQAFWELSIPPHKVAKLSGIGCSSKTPAYFPREALRAITQRRICEAAILCTDPDSNGQSQFRATRRTARWAPSSTSRASWLPLTGTAAAVRC